MFRIGERVPYPPKNRRYTVTELDAHYLPLIREYLIGVARAGGTVTYKQLKDDVGLPHAQNGLGRILDLLSVACDEVLHEPSLAGLVVTGSSGEVGSEFSGDPVAAREQIYAHWRR